MTPRHLQQRLLQLDFHAARLGLLDEDESASTGGGFVKSD